MGIEDDMLVLYLYYNVYHLEYSFFCSGNAIEYTLICFEQHIHLAMLQI